MGYGWVWVSGENSGPAGVPAVVLLILATIKRAVRKAEAEIDRKTLVFESHYTEAIYQHS